MPQRPALSGPAAAALVFAASGAVLVVEILAIRMLAPYVGLTLETYTAAIGVVLAGIALGSAAGGRAADEVDPALLLGPLLIAGGALTVITVPLVRGLGETVRGVPDFGAIFLSAVAFLPPAAVLSAVTPATAKLRLSDLRETGTVVGRLSAWATAGALTGTFLTGFVLVPLLPTPATVLGLGAMLAAAGIALSLRMRALSRAAAAGNAALVAVLALASAAAGTTCHAETKYHCARIVAGAGGLDLYLDDLRHAHVKPDPRRLELGYVRWLGAVLDATAPREAVFLGGGGFSLPRYLAATQPGARAEVLEIDPRLVDLARERLGLRDEPWLTIRTGDARTLLRDRPARSADIVVGDAFGGRSIPWHLATREFVADVQRVLRPEGVYALNLIDHGGLGLLRAETATLLEAFDHVSVISGAGSGNFVLVASGSPLPALDLDDARARDGRAVAAGARVLTDDRAPADQLLTR